MCTVRPISRFLALTLKHSGDGGLYGELVCNRALHGRLQIQRSETPSGLSTASSITIGESEGALVSTIVGSEKPSVPSAPELTGYRPVGDIKLSLDTLHRLSDALHCDACRHLIQCYRRGWLPE